MKEYFTKDASVVIFGEFFDRLNFYGIQSILVLYLIQNFLFSTDKSLSVYGVYSTLAFTLPILGGYFADRFLTRIQFVVFGVGLILGGDLLLLTGLKFLLIAGLAFIISGISLIKTNNAVLLGKLFMEQPEKRDAVFTFYYAGMNAGAISGPLCYGTMQLLFGWRYGFLASVVGSIITLIFYGLRFKYLRQVDDENPKASGWNHGKLSLLALSVFLFAYLWFHFAAYFSYFIALSGLIVAGFILYLMRPLPLVERRKALLLIASMGFGLFFYAMSLQLSSSLQLYISRSVNTKVFGWAIPPVYFVSIYPLFVILSAPFIARVWRGQTSSNSRALVHRVNASLYLACASFFIIAMSTFLGTGTVNWQLILILLALFLLGAGELSIGPVVTSAVTYLAPGHQFGIYMGLWYLLIGYSAYLATMMAKIINYATHVWVLGHNAYLEGFLLVTGFTLLIAIAMTLLSKRLKNLYPGDQVQK